MTRKLSILVLTADAGYGHRSAAIAIAEALRERYSADCSCSIINPVIDRPAPFWMRGSQTHYDQTVRNSPAFYRLTYSLSDSQAISRVIAGAVTLSLYQQMNRLLNEIHPDVILSTFHLYQGPMAAALNAHRCRIPFFSIVTDLAQVHALWFQPGPDRYFVPNEGVRRQAIRCGVAKKRVLVSGLPVNPEFAREKRSKPEIRAALGWEPDRATLLWVGSRRVNHLLDSLECIDHSDLPVQLVVVTGGDDLLYQRLQARQWRLPLHLYPFVNNLPEMMLAADVLISKAGGLVISEGLASGLPMILVDAIPGQETGNARFVCEHQAGAMAPTPEAVLAAVEGFLSSSQAAANARQLCRPEAAYQIAEYVWRAGQIQH